MTCSLRALEPRWIEADGCIIGILFSCPACSRWGAQLEGAHMVGVLFRNPPDGAAGVEPHAPMVGDNGGLRWHRQGDTFDDLSLTPSIDCTRFNPQCWHGFVTAGRVT